MSLPTGMTINAPMLPGFERVLSAEALQFVADLCHRFEPRRQELMKMREVRAARLLAGEERLDFLASTKAVREGTWQVAPVPADLQDRRVEITGPVERKMVINALNSGAKMFMADFEDSNTPIWANQVQGQINLADAIRRKIDYTSPEGKAYALNEQTAVLLVRPRGWHLDEKHVTLQGKAISGSIFDFALYLFHNAKELLARKSGPYFYLPKIESHLEARLWNELFVAAQEMLGLKQGTIKATVLIETIPAAFEMDEILYELREHSAGLNAGRWDYIFSCIKKFCSNLDFCLADRSEITMSVPFMKSYAMLLLKTCHQRGAHAIAGMNAQIPVKNNPELNEKALNAVRKDKGAAADNGYDGGWVAHPGLVLAAQEQFDRVLGTRPHQVDKQRPDVAVSAADLLNFAPETPITEAGLRMNINVSIQYLGSWLAGNGCVPIHNLMEDAATAEISRSQIWQWIRSPKGVLPDGRRIDLALCRALIAEELAIMKTDMGEAAFAANPYEKAAKLVDSLITQEPFVEFLTLPAYDMID